MDEIEHFLGSIIPPDGELRFFLGFVCTKVNWHAMESLNAVHLVLSLKHPLLNACSSRRLAELRLPSSS